ncbi:STAS domain-containing protein [Poseidonocella pacifica]|nr:STAS domain-containing protein [Poseidonocella pacifica]
MTLPDQLTTDAAPGLLDALREYEGNPLTLSAQKVSFVGGLCAQILFAARQKWAADGLSFDIEGSSSGFEESLERLGFSADTFIGG